MRIAEVYLRQKSKKIDRPFDYRIPDRLVGQVKKGMRVVVSFGRGNKRHEAFVLALKEDSDFGDSVKEILEIIDLQPVLSEAQIQLCQFIHRYYGCLFYEALVLFTAPVQSIVTAEGIKAYEESIRYYRLLKDEVVRGSVQKRIMALLRESDISREALVAAAGNTASIRNLEKKGLIESYDEALVLPRIKSVPSWEPTESDLYDRFLATNKGKVPLYMRCPKGDTRHAFYRRMIEETLQTKEGQLLLIVAENNYITYYRKAFTDLFGTLVSFYHGGLSQKERYRNYQEIAKGHVRVVIGTRSAFFLPFRHLDHILLDEANDPSYAVPHMPKYDIVTLASRWQEINPHTNVVLLEEVQGIRSIKKIEEKRWQEIPSPKNLSQSQIHVVDMMQEMRRGNLDFMSKALKKRLEKNLETGQRTVFLLNATGYANYVFCKECGYVEKCPECEVSYKYDKANALMYCGYCDQTKEFTGICPNCHQRKGYGPVGLGIDRLMEILKKRYPEYGVLTLDARDTQNSKAYRLAMEKIQSDWQILIGSSTLLRFFNYPDHIATVGVLLADIELNRGHYTASEQAYRFFNLLRTLTPDVEDVWVQTHQPEHYVLKGLEKPQGYYQEEIAFRKLLRYPPYGNLIQLMIFGKQPKILLKDAGKLYEWLKEEGLECYRSPNVMRIRGRDQFKTTLMVKTEKLENFHKAMKTIVDKRETYGFTSKVSIDVNPLYG